MASRDTTAAQSGLMVRMALGGAVLIVGFSQVPVLWMGLPLLVGAGFCWVCTGIGAQTLLQTGVDDSVRGRVLSLYGLIVKAAPAVGALGVGMLSDRIGLQAALLGSAAIATIYVLLQYPLICTIRADLEPDRP